MISFRKLTTFSLFGLMSVLAGCGGDATRSESADNVPVAQLTQPAVAKTAERMPQEHMGRGGPGSLLHAALRAPINLSAEQKATIESTLQQSAPKPGQHAPMFDKDRAQALAAAIRSGNVDALRAKSPEKNAAHAKLIEERSAAAVDALATLHKTLTKEQRIALVDTLSKRDAERSERPQGNHAKHAERQGKGDVAMKGDAKRFQGQPRGKMGPGKMLEGLDLTQAQKDAIFAKLGDKKPTAENREAMKAKMATHKAEFATRLQTFAKDDFDAKAFVAKKQVERAPQAQADQRHEFLAVVTSVLEPAQREKLAARIEQGPPAHMMKRGGRHEAK